MNWITTERVAEQAKLGEIPALECSLLHHEQGRDADWVELRDAIKDDKFNLGEDLCACCQSGDKRCADCLLGSYWCRDSKEWNGLKDSYFGLYQAVYSNANFKAFQEAEADLCTYIEGVIAKKKAKEKKQNKLCPDCKHNGGNCISSDDCVNFEPKHKESKPALRHGDYGLGKNSWGDPKSRIIIRNETYNQYGKVCDSANRKNDIWLGNIFDDLARNAEDLDRFEIRHDGESGKNHWGNVTSHIHSDGDKIWLWVGTNSAYYNFDQITEIAHKLLQEVATAKKWQQPKEKPRKAGSDESN